MQGPAHWWGLSLPERVRGRMSTEFERSIKSSILKVVAAHWLAVRGGRDMPAWASLMPSALKLQLPYVWSYAYHSASDSFTGRLAGDRVSAIFGDNFHGLPMSEAQPTQNYPSLFAKCKRVITEPGLYSGSGITFNHAGNLYGGERIIMPLQNVETGGLTVFGAIDFSGRFPKESQKINFDAEIENWFGTNGEKVTG